MDLAYRIGKTVVPMDTTFSASLQHLQARVPGYLD